MKYRCDCPKCGKERYYNTLKLRNRTQKLNRLCRACANLDGDLRKVRSDNVKGKKNHFSRDIKSGVDNPFYGKKHTLKTKEIISLKNTGKHAGKNNPNYGKTHSEEARRKIRIAMANRIRDKYGVCLDKGSTEWFSVLNGFGFQFEEGFHLEPLGYFADGYDKTKNTWVEYDTQYHNKLSQKKKDLERQQNIIRYFESIGKPLAQFLRYNTTTDTLKVMYRGKNWMKDLQFV